MTATAVQLSHVPAIAFHTIDTKLANALLMEWGHRLGPCNRPFRSEAHAMEVGGRLVAVSMSASVVSATVGGLRRTEVVELARLGRAPDCTWSMRVMLRIWREVFARQWKCWPVRAAVSYSHNAMHRGDLYRFDGWEKIREDCGSRRGGAWSRKRYATDAVHGSKTLWLWRYA